MSNTNSRSEKVAQVLNYSTSEAELDAELNAALVGQRLFQQKYESITSRKDPSVRFTDALISKARNTRLAKDSADGRILRPRTAELPPSMRKTITDFRELDKIVFCAADDGLSTPTSTPLSQSRQPSAKTNPAGPFSVSSSNRMILENIVGKPALDNLLRLANNDSPVESTSERSPLRNTRSNIYKVKLDKQLLYHLADPPILTIPTKASMLSILPSIKAVGTSVVKSERQSDFAISAEPGVFEESSESLGDLAGEDSMIGFILPLQWFVEDERINIWQKMIGTKTVFLARCWPTASNNVAQSFLGFLQSTDTNDHWKQCYIESFDNESKSFGVHFLIPQVELGVQQTVKSRKLQFELISPGESLAKIKGILLQAHALRVDFEKAIATTKFIHVLKPLIDRTSRNNMNKSLENVRKKISSSGAFFEPILDVVWDREIGDVLDGVATSTSMSFLHSCNRYKTFMQTGKTTPRCRLVTVEGCNSVRSTVLEAIPNMFMQPDIRNTIYKLCVKLSEVFHVPILDMLKGIIPRYHHYGKEDFVVEKAPEPVKALHARKKSSFLGSGAETDSRRKKAKDLFAPAPYISKKSDTIQPTFNRSEVCIFSCGDFLDFCSYRFFSFQHAIEVLIPTLVYQYYEELLSLFGMAFPCPLEKLFHMTLKQVVDSLVIFGTQILVQKDSHEIAKRLGIFLSLQSESCLYPYIMRRALEFYQVLRNGTVAVGISLELQSHNNDIVFDTNIDNFKCLLEKLTDKWTSYSETKLPSKCLPTTHTNDSLLRQMLRELISESVCQANEFIQAVRNLLIPLFHTSSVIPSFQSGTTSYLEHCSDILVGLQKILAICRSKLSSPQTRGLFVIETSNMGTQVQQWVTETERTLTKSVLHAISTKVQNFHLGACSSWRYVHLL